MQLQEGELFIVSPQYFKSLYARVIDSVAGTALVYFSDGTAGSEFKERHELWQSTDQPLAYLAGPMRGHYRFNAPKFSLYEQGLNAMGYLVINPAKVDSDVGFDPYLLPDEHDWNEVPFGFKMQRTVTRCSVGVAMSDRLYLMDGWQTSRGAKAELAVAQWLGMPIYELFGQETNPGEYSFYERRYMPDVIAEKNPPEMKPAKKPGVFQAVRNYVSLYLQNLREVE